MSKSSYEERITELELRVNVMTQVCTHLIQTIGLGNRDMVDRLEQLDQQWWDTLRSINPKLVE